MDEWLKVKTVSNIEQIQRGIRALRDSGIGDDEDAARGEYNSTRFFPVRLQSSSGGTNPVLYSRS